MNATAFSFSTSKTCGLVHKEKALKPRSFKAFVLAGAEGLEPSARGFGEKTEKHTNLSCFNKRGASSHELADDSTTNRKSKISGTSINTIEIEHM